MIAEVLVDSIKMYRSFFLHRIGCVGKEGRQCAQGRSSTWRSSGYLGLEQELSVE